VVIGLFFAGSTTLLAEVAHAAPILEVEATHVPDPAPAGTYVKYTLSVANVGDVATKAPITLSFAAPAGFKIAQVTPADFFGIPLWDCSISGDTQMVACVGPGPGGSIAVGPGEEACVGSFLAVHCPVFVSAKVLPEAQPGAFDATAEACGGGATSCDVATVRTDVIPDGYRIESFDGHVLQQNGEPAIVAGSHPFVSEIGFRIGVAGTADGQVLPYGSLKDVDIDLPPGLAVDPTATTPCTAVKFSGGEGGCSPDSQIGVATFRLIHQGGELLNAYVPIYNLEPGQGQAALFGFRFEGLAVRIVGRVRTGDDYGLTMEVKNAPALLAVSGFDFSLWGTPASPAFDGLRGDCMDATTGQPGPGLCPSTNPPKPFLTLPTSCGGVQRTDLSVSSWDKGDATASFLAHDNTFPEPGPIEIVGCNVIQFSPTLEARPTTNVTDSPSGLDLDLHVPQNREPGTTASADLRDVVIDLPEGLVINPAGANGLDGCSPAQIALHDAGSPSCPEASKLGTAEIETPLMDHPLPGAVFLATPHSNPFDALFAVYVVIADADSGILVKVPGWVEPDPHTGRLRANFPAMPQLPLENLRLKFFGDSAAPLRTPPACGIYSTRSSLTPWSAPDSGAPETPTDSWTISRVPSGGGCVAAEAELPFTPSLEAGTIEPVAGTSSPFLLRLSRRSGTQQLEGMELSLPPGLTAELEGIPLCHDSALEEAVSSPTTGPSSACPASARLGSADVATGSGQRPLHFHGDAYLAGPYEGAPVSVAVLVPALAGPFDLGTVVLRIAVHVDPATAQLRLVSDPLPVIRSGVPLSLRSVELLLDRPGLIRNPTSCDAFSVAGVATSTTGATVALSRRFQVGGCGSLGFKPRISVHFSGALDRNGHPALTLELDPRPADASIADASFTLPASELLDTRHVGTLCTRPLPPELCPPASRLGIVRLFSPVLNSPLEGSIYLRTPSHRLPDLFADLRSGQYHIVLHGHTAAPRGRLRVRFTELPDLPVARASFTLAGGRHGIIVNSETLCGHPLHAAASLSAHSGKQRRLRPRVSLHGPC
jgi:hypothetical protein